MKVVFIEKKQVAADSWELRFEKPEGFEFSPGQFNEYHLPHENEDERGEQRWFTISNSPTRDYLSITTRFVDRHSSFKDALFKLKPGGYLKAKGPLGKFVLPTQAQIPLVWVAGGIGITPFKAQIQWMLDTEGVNRSITLFYGNRTIKDNACKDLLDKFSKANPHFNLVEVLSEQAPKGWKGESGYIDAQKITNYVEYLKDSQFFVSGPEPMVDAFKPILKGLGVNEKNIHGDWFPGYTDKY